MELLKIIKTVSLGVYLMILKDPKHPFIFDFNLQLAFEN